MQLKVTGANIEYGGLDRRNGDNASALLTLERLAENAPDILAIQEMYALDPNHVRRQMWWWANQLSMWPFLGGCANIGSKAGSYNAIFIRPDVGIRIIDEWPGPVGAELPFCTSTLQIHGVGSPVHVTSAHLAARTKLRRLESAEIIGSYSADRIDAGDHVIVAGDFNGFPRYGPGDLEVMPPRLLGARANVDAAGVHHPDFSADDALTDGFLEDLAAVVSRRNDDYSCLEKTGPGGVRVDRIYANSVLARTCVSYERITTGADHDAVSVVFDLPEIAA